MIVLHLAAADGRLALWGEGPPTDADAPETAHPFAADADALAAALGEAGIDAGAAEDAWAWLPTVAGRPVASSPLLDAAPAEGDVALALWRVAAIPLAAEEAEALFAAATDRYVLVPGVLLGDSVTFWAQAHRFAVALVAREQFLPGLVETADGWRAVWEPVFVGADAERLVHLAAAMPHVGRALAPPARKRPKAAPKTAPADVLRQRLAGFTDHRVRSAVWVRQPTKAPAPTFDSVHEQWMHALRTADGGMDADAADLAEPVRQWRRRLAITAEAPFRLTFRLEAPDTSSDDESGADALRPSGTWTVRLLFQAADDPSLLLDAADAWDPDPQTAALFARRGFRPQEHLLAALGQAMDLFPALESSLIDAAPDRVELDLDGAYHFLTETAWLLQQAGFGVRLPAWWARRGGRRLSAGATVKSPPMQASGGLSLDSLVDVDWHAVVGDETLSREELEALAEIKVPLVQLRGEWVEVDAEAIRAGLAFWDSRETLTARDAVRLALGLDGSGGLPVEHVDATGWMGDLLRQLEDGDPVEPLPTPDGFEGTLRPYQERGASWLAFLQQWGLGACLADDMGLGKTVQTLALVQHNKEEGQRKPVLLVCPTSVLGNWQREAARFTPELAVTVHHGARRTKDPAEFRKEAKKHDLVITSYALLHRDEETFKKVRWQAVVLDEAQNVKNPRTKQAQAARALKSEHRIALTGTPVENHVGDLWALMEFLNPGLLGSQAEFKREFFRPIQNRPTETASGDAAEARDAADEAASRLKRLTGPFILRRLKTDKAIISDLPDKREMEVFTTLTKEQASLYRAVVKETEAALTDAEGIARKGLVLSTLTRLKQVCNHPAQFLHDGSAVAGRSGKLARLTEMLDEVLASGERALLFTQFTEMGGIVRRHLQETFGREVFFLHGGTSRTRRDEMVERFQTDPDGPPFFLLSLKAGGTGLTLTRANHVFHIDRWWNPAVENQATDRAFRIGQTRDVQVHKFVCIGTVEERVHEMIERKKAVAESVVGTGEGWITELSTRDLKKLFRLRKDAVRE